MSEIEINSEVLDTIVETEITTEENITVSKHSITHSSTNIQQEITKSSDNTVIEVIDKEDSIQEVITSRHSVTFSQQNIIKSSEVVGIEGRLEDELGKQRSIFEGHSSELSVLKKTLFQSGTSLRAQEEKARSHYKQREDEARSKLKSIGKLEHEATDIEREMERMNEINVNMQKEILNEKENLIETLVEMVRFEKLLERINKEIQSIEGPFQLELDDLEKQRLELLNQPDSPSKERLIKELDKKIKELRFQYDEDLKILRNRRSAVERLSKIHEDNVTFWKQDIVGKHADEIRRLESLKLGATPSEIERIDQQIRELEDQLEATLLSVEQLQDDSEPHFLIGDDGVYHIDENGTKIYRETQEDDTLEKESEIEEESEWSLRECDDVPETENEQYIKRVLGKPLRQALAAITVYKPTDPINYLGNYLLQYHYNEQRNIEKQKEFEEMLYEREKYKNISRKRKFDKSCNPCKSTAE